MKVVIFGSTGGIGLQLVEHALKAGHHVTALARSPEKFPMQHEQLQIVHGNVLDYNRVEGAMNAQDAALSALGSNQHGPVSICKEGTKLFRHAAY
jgi:putative NADH-flavin reductase